LYYHYHAVGKMAWVPYAADREGDAATEQLLLSLLALLILQLLLVLL
jgi:hypothetical protein